MRESKKLGIRGPLFFTNDRPNERLLSSYRVILYICCSLLISCTTTHSSINISLEKALASPSTLQIPYEASNQGLMIIEAELPDIGSKKFILDTGATSSGVFAKSLPKGVNIWPKGRDVHVHSISRTEIRETVHPPYLKLGGVEINGIQLVLINPSKHDEVLLNQTIGVIGLDVLSRYKLFVDPQTQTLSLIDQAAPPITLIQPWTQIPMTEELYNTSALGLHFLELRMGGQRTFALFDTGAEYNVMNWNFKTIWQLSIRRRSMKKQWEHSGALGEFEPIGLAKIEGIHSRQYTWPQQTFSVFDIKSFETIGLKDKPLMIAGMPFFENRSLFVDFFNNYLWVKSGDGGLQKAETRVSKPGQTRHNDTNKAY